MAQPPTFFFSYARQDREGPGNYLRRFFDDLEFKVAEWAGQSLQERKLGTIDSRVPQGENWDAVLSQSLANDNTLVAVLTPLYLKRPNCGRELAMFLLRSPNLGIDQNGKLTGARNILLIRWMPENAYSLNTGKDSLIPRILGLIEDTPADDGNDPERTQSIERYKKKGMERCVSSEPHYSELLNLLAARIKDMETLPTAGKISFATAPDAFGYDWRVHFESAGVRVAAPASPATPIVDIVPRPLASVVTFYITQRPFAADPNPIDFAGGMIAEYPWDKTSVTDAELRALLADVRAAGVAEGLTVFHAVSNPVVPVGAEPLLGQLAALSAAGIPTALIVEPAIWPGPRDAASIAVEQVIRSAAWTGPVFLPALRKRAINVDELGAALDLPPRLLWLPDTSEERITLMRRAFVDTRGRLLRTTSQIDPNAEHMPLLKSVSMERV